MNENYYRCPSCAYTATLDERAATALLRHKCVGGTRQTFLVNDDVQWVIRDDGVLTDRTESCTVGDVSDTPITDPEDDDMSTALAEAAEQEAEIEALVEWLAVQTWSKFALSVADWYKEKGFLTPKQEAAARNMMSKKMAEQEANDALLAESPLVSKEYVEALTAEAKPLGLDDLIGKTFTVKAGGTPAAEVKTPAYEPKDGEFHVIDGTIVRVKANRTKTATYGMVAKVIDPPEWVVDGKAQVSWSYDGKKHYAGMSADTLMTWEQARDIGVLTDNCIRCGRALTDDRSVAAGYGETCAKHGNGAGAPWFYPDQYQADEILAERTAKGGAL